VILLDAIIPDPSSGYNFYKGENRGDDYFNRDGSVSGRSRRKLTTGVSF